MKNWIKIIVLGLSVVASGAMAETNIAVVDMERALFQSEGAKASFKQVEDQFGDDLEKLKALEQDMLDVQQKMQKDGAIMSDDEQRKLRNTVKEKQSEYQFFAGKLQKAEQEWRQQFFRASLPRMQTIMKELIEKEEVDLVLNGQAVIHVTPDLDLTKKLLNELNKASSAK
ncbi:OmpH family outer membrane protein [Bermanella sp. R86510]|uniref:OmpH family outer membrane protein n=1 Tax=unclassified Bermanella TaxID=2627862 RepID=UPI0037CCC2B5